VSDPFRLLTLAAASLLLFACGPDGAGRAPQVTAEEAEEALSAFGLEAPGRAQWSDRRFENGAYEFSGFVLAGEDGELRARTLRLTGPRSQDGETRFERLELEEGHIVFEDGEARFEHAVIDQPGPELSAAIAAAISGGEFDWPEDGRRGAFARAAITALSVESADGREAPFRLTVDNLAAEDSDGVRLGRFLLEGLELEGRDEEGGALHLAIGRMEASGLDGGVLEGLDDIPAMQTNAFAAAAGLYESFAVRDLSVQAGGAVIAMREMTGVMTPERGGLRAVTRMPQLRLSPEPGVRGQPLAMALNMLGYENFDFSFEAESVFMTGEGRMRTEGENHLTLADGFRIEFEQDLGGFSDAAAQAEEILVHGLSLRIEDRSILDRALASAAAAQGITAEQMRQQAGMLVPVAAMYAGSALPRGVFMQAQTALTAFIAQGGTLVIEMAPPEPIPASVLANGDASSLDAARLGLTVRHEAPR